MLFPTTPVFFTFQIGAKPKISILMKRTGLLFVSAIIGTAFFSTLLTFILLQRYYIPVPQQIVRIEPAAARFTTFSNPSTATNIAPSEMPDNFVATSNKITPAVANITAYRGSYRASSGSGVIISQDGYIITNHHVVEGASSYEVTLFNNRELKAKLIGSDPTTDLALLKVEAKGLEAVNFGNSDRVQVGEWVLAVGNPFNLASTVTAGIVSAKGRNINILEGEYSIESFIQTDAVVNPGNSGGALVNIRGELIGINTAIISESGGYEGYSFAIPSNLVLKVIKDLKEYGEVQRAILGVLIADVDDSFAREMDLPSVAGVRIRAVNAGTTAAKAGLRTDDVIIGINDVETRSMPELQEQIARYRPGDEISIEYIRKGKRYRQEKVQLQALQKESYGYRRNE